MAIIVEGRIVRQGAPGDLMMGLKGHIWMKTIDKADLDAARARYQVISTRLFAGRTVIHIFAEADPGDGFAQADGGLEDVYFSTLASSRKAA